MDRHGGIAWICEEGRRKLDAWGAWGEMLGTDIQPKEAFAMFSLFARALACLYFPK